LGLGIVSPVCVLDVVGGIKTSRSGVTSPATTDGNIFSGTYTPIQVSTNTNVDSLTFGACQYMRVGDVVTVSGQIGIDATTATTDTVAKMSVPIASNFTSSRQLAGVGSSLTTPYAANNLAIIADTTNDCVEIRLRPSVNTALNYNFTFTYAVI
jgi:enamine deaminase RidA (YjgF/YER057c/UK114 family)